VNVVLEGPSDRWILDGLLKLCKRMELTTIDPATVAFVGVGGAEKMPYFTHLLSTEGLRFSCLLDHDTKGRKVKQTLIEDYGVPGVKVLTLEGAIGEGRDAVIEDLFDDAFYVDAVNRSYYGLQVGNATPVQVTLESFRAVEGGTVKRLTRIFRDSGFGDFDKERVARTIHSLVTAPDFNLAQYQNTKDRFVALFERLRLSFSNQIG